MSDYTQPNRPALTRLFLVLLPLAAMLAAFVWIASLDPLRSFNNGAPPVEALTVERTVLDQTGIRMLVRAGGSEAMQIAQVAVDDAYWTFTQDPPGTIVRGKKNVVNCRSAVVRDGHDRRTDSTKERINNSRCRRLPACRQQSTPTGGGLRELLLRTRGGL